MVGSDKCGTEKRRLGKPTVSGLRRLLSSCLRHLSAPRFSLSVKRMVTHPSVSFLPVSSKCSRRPYRALCSLAGRRWVVLCLFSQMEKSRLWKVEGASCSKSAPETDRKTHPLTPASIFLLFRIWWLLLLHAVFVIDEIKCFH